MPSDPKPLSSTDLHFFVYPFSEKEVATLPVLDSNKDDSFGLALANDELSGRTFIRDIKNNKSSSAARMFGNFNRSRKKLRGAYITHIDNAPVFSTADAEFRLRSLFQQWQKARKHESRGWRSNFRSKLPLLGKSIYKEKS